MLIVALALAPDATAKCCALVTPPPPEGIAVGEKWRTLLDVEGVLGRALRRVGGRGPGCSARSPADLTAEV